MTTRRYKIQEKQDRVVVNIAPQWKQYMLQRAKELGYMSLGDYVRDLIRRDLASAGYLKS